MCVHIKTSPLIAKSFQPLPEKRVTFALRKMAAFSTWDVEQVWPSLLPLRGPRHVPYALPILFSLLRVVYVESTGLPPPGEHARRRGSPARAVAVPEKTESPQGV